LLFGGLIVHGAYTTSDIDYETVANPETLTTLLTDIMANQTAESYTFTPTTTAPSLAEGKVYYDDTANALMLSTNGTSWTTIDAATGNSLDSAYNLGGGITVDGSAVTLTAGAGVNNACLSLVQNDTTNDPDALTIVTTADSGTQTAIDITSSAGYDIQGTSDLWEVSNAGVGDFAGLIVGGTDVTLENGGVINNTTNNEIEFIENSEEFSFAFNGNTLTLATDTGITTVDWGDLTTASGMTTITGDAADMTISITADAAGEDLLIQQAGAVDGSLDLRSAGTGADAVKVVASGGGFDLDAVDDVIITVASTTTADDLALVQTGANNSGITLAAAGTGDDAIDLNASAGGVDIDGVKSVTISSTEASDDSIVISAAGTAGGIDITSLGDIDISTTGAAGEDITITNTGGSIAISATENIQNGVHIEANGGTSESINLYANQGTGSSATTEHDASIQLQSDDGGIGIYTTGDVADAFRLETNGGTSETIVINNLQGTGAGAITIAANAAGGDLNLDSVLGRIEIEAEENVANALYLIADGGTATTLEIFNDTGTSVTEDAAAIQLLADAGGICIQSDADLDDALVLRVDGGTTSEMTLHNDQGNTADSIELLSDAGGITLNASSGVVFTQGQTRSVIFMPTDVELDSAKPPGTTSIGTSEQAEFDTLGFDSNPNATGDDSVFINWVVPAGYIADSADLHVYWSHSTAEDAADECVIDGTVNAVAAGEALDAAGTGMTAVTSVIADASASAGTLIKTSLDIEVEDIAVADLVCIWFWFDESACLMAASGTADVHYFEITYESSE
jgi:hypothetical protein